MTVETSILNYSREEALPYANALANLYLNALSQTPELADNPIGEIRISDGERTAFERRQFQRDGFVYAITVGIGENFSEFGISRSKGEKFDSGNIESVVIYKTGQEASVSYANGSLISGSQASREVNTIGAVSHAYEFLHSIDPEMRGLTE